MIQSRLVILTIVTVVALGAYVLGRTSTPHESARSGLATFPVTVGSVEKVVLAAGSFEPLTQVSVGAQVSGRIEALHVELGQVVEVGELIAEIDGITQENALRSAEAELAVLKAQRLELTANLSYSNAVLARHKHLVDGKAVTRDAFEKANMEVHALRAQIKAIDAKIVAGQVEVETAIANIGYTRITAPIFGRVLAIMAKEGQTVNAAQSAPTIVVIGNTSRMKVKAAISEADVMQVEPGQQVYFSVLGAPEFSLHGTVSFVEPAPNSIAVDNNGSLATGNTASSTGTEAIYYNAHFEVPNSDERLRTSMTAQVKIIVGRVEDVLTIPSLAIHHCSNKAVVETIGVDGKHQIREVTVGMDNKITAEVSTGLEVDERVIVPPNASSLAEACAGNDQELAVVL